MPGHDKAQPKPLTPLLAPIRVAMKPLTPLRGANRHSLKPRAPLQAETRLISAIFRPQWCQWFHSTMITGQQRCPRFHPRRSAASKGVLGFMQHALAPLIRRCGLPRPKSHAIPLSPTPTRAYKHWNLKDLLPRLKGLTGELHAKLQSPRLETATRTARSVRSGTAKPAAPARTIMPRCSETWTPDVTNVVKSEHFQPLNTGSCYKRRQSKPKTPDFWRNNGWIDDVCNNHPGRRTKSCSD